MLPIALANATVPMSFDCSLSSVASRRSVTPGPIGPTVLSMALPLSFAYLFVRIADIQECQSFPKLSGNPSKFQMMCWFLVRRHDLDDVEELTFM
jgi:hypothetical protein